MRNDLKLLLFLILNLYCFTEIKAQVCNGALGAPIAGAGTDFGNGIPAQGGPIAETNYTYVAGNPADGQYTIVKTTAGLNSGWHQNVMNHTNDPNGYFMVVNANINSGVFYEKIINNLCPNTTYEFAAYIINILRNPGIRPNVKFSIIYNNSPSSVSTGDIPEGTATDWIKYGTTFTTPANVTSITLRMTNDNPGGNGNDLAIDDITFRACGPTISQTFTNVNTVINGDGNICVGDTRTVQLTAQLSAAYSNPEFQWQEFDGASWINSTKVGAQTTVLSIPFVNATAGSYPFRLIVAESGNINNPTCNVISTPLSIIVNQPPNVQATNSGITCVGADLFLFASNGVSFEWSGPNGYYSNAQNPIINNVDATHAGEYTVIATNAGGCTTTSKTTVQIYPAVNASINYTTITICEGESVPLIATGGLNYSWLPTNGLSDASIANPIATPTQTTTYTVSIDNGICTATKQVTIEVLAPPLADAGTDRKLVLGQAIQLNGNVSGSNITYFWTPTDYLDDPNKLSPIANPPTNITYTLHVTSSCGTSTDEVFLKVYPKVEISNTFTPNGDGINDTWMIPSISSFPNPKLTIVNRYGQVVFQSRNNSAWDGNWNGKAMPSGSYYYTLYLNDKELIYSGWVLLAR